SPWDKGTIAESVGRTGRLVTVEEATAGSGWGGEIVAAISAAAFGALLAPPHRITLPDAPVPYNGDLEARYLPSAAYVAEQVDALFAAGRPPPPWWEKHS